MPFILRDPMVSNQHHQSQGNGMSEDMDAIRLA